jgi:hypothetical protein
MRLSSVSVLREGMVWAVSHRWYTLNVMTNELLHVGSPLLPIRHVRQVLILDHSY